MILRDLASVMDILKDLKPCALKVKQKHMCRALPGELIDCEMPASIPTYSIAERGGKYINWALRWMTRYFHR